MATYFQTVSQKFFNIARPVYPKNLEITSERCQSQLQFLPLGDFIEIILLFQLLVVFWCEKRKAHFAGETYSPDV